MGVQDGLGTAGGARGPEDEGGSRGVGAGPGKGADAVGPEDGRRRGGSEHPLDLRLGQPGLTGTKTAPASQIPTMAITTSGPLGSWTATA